MNAPSDSFVLGWREWVSMPQIGLPAIKAKIDTGARTSALHAFSIETFGPEHQPKVRFGVHPVEDRDDIEIYCTAKVIDRRQVISSNGQSEMRYVISHAHQDRRPRMAHRNLAVQPRDHGAPHAARANGARGAGSRRASPGPNTSTRG